MFVVRQAAPRDQEMFLKLARMVNFINLPPDAEVVHDKIAWSRACFETVRAGAPDRDSAELPGLRALGGAAGRSPQYMFALEDPETGNPVGTSAVISRMGSADAPNLYFRLEKREFFSRDLQAGATHVTAKLTLDESGPSEIGGLILSPSFRGHPSRLGKLLSLVRFHYMGLQRARFQDRVIAEMMAPISADGTNPFWEAVGRRFINLTYDQADRFCAKSREFMISLLPHDPIYLTLLPAEARRVVAQVGPETLPARKMLEGLGFEHRDLVDPFDAGPILEARTDEITLVRETFTAPVAPLNKGADGTQSAIVSFDGEEAGFRAVMVPASRDGGEVRVAPAAIEAIGAEAGATVGVTPLPPSKRRTKKAPKAKETA